MSSNLTNAEQIKAKDNNKDKEDNKVKAKKDVDALNNIPLNKVLIANFPSYQSLCNYMKKNKDCMRYVIFGNNDGNMELNESQLNNLSINKDNKYNELITKFWNISEADLLNILNHCYLDIPPKEFSYITAKYAWRTNQITSICAIKGNVINRNELTSIRKKCLTKNDIKMSKNAKSSMDKYYFLSNIIFKKYITLFYNVQTHKLDSPGDLYIYNAYYQEINNENLGTHLSILKQIKNNLKKIYLFRTKSLALIEPVCIYKALEKMFNSPTFPYKEQIDLIKNLLNDETYFVNADEPFNLFQEDLMKLNINFDYYQSYHYYNKILPENIKLRYKLRYIQSKLINDYKESLLKRYDTLKKKEKENKDNDITNELISERLNDMKVRLPEKLKKREYRNNVPTGRKKNVNKINKEVKDSDAGEDSVEDNNA